MLNVCQDGGEMRTISIILLAKDEAANIGRGLDQISRQSLLNDERYDIEILVVPNGCTDDTAAVAERCGEVFQRHPRVSFKVVDLPTGGKSRAWNRSVHELSRPSSGYLLFLDADIALANDAVFATLVDHLVERDQTAVVSGLPFKDSYLKKRRSSLDRFSHVISEETRYRDAICGSLYVGRADELRAVWLPLETPGEDGFLNAMVTTFGFSQPCPQPGRVVQVSTVTHHYAATTPAQFFKHERRMIVGTMINHWIFDHLMARRKLEPAGPLIAALNEDNPDWVQDIIDRRIGGRFWVVSPNVAFRRIKSSNRRSRIGYLAKLPFLAAATILTLPAAMMANQTLRERGAAATW